MVRARTRRRGQTAPAGGTRRPPRPVPSVGEEQRRRLIECCAFFRAQRYREAAPGYYREQDLRAAAEDIDSLITSCRKRKKR